MGFFFGGGEGGGLIFGSGIFLHFVGSPRDFLGFDFCPHFIIPITRIRNPEYPPPPRRDEEARTWEKRAGIHCIFQPKMNDNDFSYHSSIGVENGLTKYWHS